MSLTLTKWSTTEIIRRSIHAPFGGPATDKLFYVAGPMTGYPKWNFPAFDKARDELVAEGHSAISPSDLDRQRGITENMAPGEFPEDAFQVAMQIDLTVIASWATHIYLLKGWSASRGAVIELRVAQACGRGIRLEEGAETSFLQREMLIHALEG